MIHTPEFIQTTAVTEKHKIRQFMVPVTSDDKPHLSSSCEARMATSLLWAPTLRLVHKKRKKKNWLFCFLLILYYMDSHQLCYYILHANCSTELPPILSLPHGNFWAKDTSFRSKKEDKENISLHAISSVKISATIYCPQGKADK